MQATNRVTMERDLELQKKYGLDAVCGYIRSPMEIKGHIRGICALDGMSCYRAIPMNEQECRVYKQYFFLHSPENRSKDVRG